MKTYKKIFNLIIIVSLFIVGGIMINDKTINNNPFILTVRAEEDSEEEKDEKDEKDESEAQNEAEEEAEKVDEDNENPFKYVNDTGQLQVQTTGDDLQADIYVVIKDEAGVERTIYVSPYRDSKNEQRIVAGTHTVKEIYLLNEDYKDAYDFKHNDKLIVFPDEKVFFDIEVIEVKETKKNELLLDDNELEETEEQIEEVEHNEDNTQEEAKKSGVSRIAILIIGVLGVLGVLIYGILKYFGFLNK